MMNKSEDKQFKSIFHEAINESSISRYISPIPNFHKFDGILNRYTKKYNEK